MERTISNWVSHLCVAIALLAVNASTAAADAILTYSVADLGAGYAQLAKDASGKGIVIAPDGLNTYAFPRTENRLGDPCEIMEALPKLNNAPVWDPMTYGNPKNAYSDFVSD